MDNPGLDESSEITRPVRIKTSRYKFLFELVQTLALAFILYFLIDSVVARVRVENISMLPTLESGQFLLVNKLAYRHGDFQYGDIIVFHYPDNPREDYIKRTIGLPGDSIEVFGEKVIVNGIPMEEPYTAEPTYYTGEWNVPEGFLFVLGDNRNQSSDSHSWGFVPIDNVVGRAIVIYWPLDEMKILNHPTVVSAANNE